MDVFDVTGDVEMCVVVVTSKCNDVCVDDCVDVVRSYEDDVDNFILSRPDNMDVVDVEVVVVVMCVVVCDEENVVRVKCDVVVSEDEKVVCVECETEDNNARARCLVEGGLILGMIMSMGTEIRVR